MEKQRSLDWMMWQIDDASLNNSPLANLIEAIQYYNNKYGAVPNRCEVPEGWSDDLKAPAGIIVTPSPTVRPRHIHLTVDPGVLTNGDSVLPRRQKT